MTFTVRPKSVEIGGETWYYLPVSWGDFQDSADMERLEGLRHLIASCVCDPDGQRYFENAEEAKVFPVSVSVQLVHEIIREATEGLAEGGPLAELLSALPSAGESA